MTGVHPCAAHIVLPPLMQATLEQAAQQEGRIDQLERMVQLGQQEVQQLEEQLQRVEQGRQRDNDQKLHAGPLRS